MGEAACSVCGRAALPGRDFIVYDGKRICGDCKADYFQRLREGLGDEREDVPLNEYLRRVIAYSLYGVLSFVPFILAMALIGVATKWSDRALTPALLTLYALDGIALFEFLRWRSKPKRGSLVRVMGPPLGAITIFASAGIAMAIALRVLDTRKKYEFFADGLAFSGVFLSPALPALTWMFARTGLVALVRRLRRAKVSG